MAGESAADCAAPRLVEETDGSSVIHRTRRRKMANFADSSPPSKTDIYLHHHSSPLM